MPDDDSARLAWSADTAPHLARNSGPPHCDHATCPGCAYCPCHDTPGGIVRGIVYGLAITAVVAVAGVLGIWAWSVMP